MSAFQDDYTTPHTFATQTPELYPLIQQGVFKKVKAFSHVGVAAWERQTVSSSSLSLLTKHGS